MAYLYQQQRQYILAAELYNQLVKIDSNHALWWVGLGRALEAAGKKNAAQEAYHHALQGSLDMQTRNFVEHKITVLG